MTFAGICQSKIDIFITKFVLPLFKGESGIVSPNFGFILGAFQGNEEMRATISCKIFETKFSPEIARYGKSLISNFQ